LKLYEPEFEPDDEEEETEVTTAGTKYAELKNKLAEARKQMEETAKTAFREMSAELFEANPDLMAFSWTQYTPYFNDGDECVFRSNGEYPTVAMMINGQLIAYNSDYGRLEINGEKARTREEYIRSFENMPKTVTSYIEDGHTIAFDRLTNTVTKDGMVIPTYEDYSKQFDPLERIVGKFMSNFEDDDLKAMFGDHVRVTVYRNGDIDKEEHEHD